MDINGLGECFEGDVTQEAEPSGANSTKGKLPKVRVNEGDAWYVVGPPHHLCATDIHKT